MHSQRLLMPLLPLAGVAALAAATAGNASADAEWASRGGHVVIPNSSIEAPEHVGHRAHTNFKMFVPAGGAAARQTAPDAVPEAGGPPFAGYLFETPASLACVYQLVAPRVAGCNPNTATVNPNGGARAIAIVDAYHYPTASSDLAVFSAQFGLPPANLQVVFANGRQPSVDGEWNIEEALDIEWAHAMAPNAKIYLVEAATPSFANLVQAVSVAGELVAAAGGGEISMSWGGSEFPNQTSFDSYFSQTGVVYFAASGDSSGVIWPSTSLKVVAVGGTSISRSRTTGAFQAELAWQSGGGGSSLYEPRPGYQNAISAIVQDHRGTPDVAADADPSTGVWVYASPYWYVIGGTSAAAPVWAGIVNAAGGFSPTSHGELVALYRSPGNTSDIVLGSCGPNQGNLASAGWDFCTGVGSPTGYSGK